MPDLTSIHALVIWYEAMISGDLLLHRDYRRLLTQYAQDQVESNLIGKEILDLLPEMMHKAMLETNITVEDWTDFIRLWTNLNSEQARWVAHLKKTQQHSNSLMQTVLCRDRTARERDFAQQNHDRYCYSSVQGFTPDIELGSSEMPVFLIGNEFNPRAPQVWYQELKTLFPKAYSIMILNSIEHGSVFSGARVIDTNNLYGLDELAVLFLLYADQPESQKLQLEVDFAPNVETSIFYE